MIRTFVAVELDEALRAAIGRAQAALRDKLDRELRRADPGTRIQWVRPESVHVTLKFLGDIEEDRVATVGQALERAVVGVAPFALDVGGLGMFPEAGGPRVLWLGLSGPVEAMARLASAVDAALQEIGFPPEDRPFTPHLTLARVKERSREVGRAMAACGLPGRETAVGRLEVRALALMKSELRPTGARYTRLQEVRLPG